MSTALQMRLLGSLLFAALALGACSSSTGGSGGSTAGATGSGSGSSTGSSSSGSSGASTTGTTNGSTGSGAVSGFRVLVGTSLPFAGGGVVDVTDPQHAFQIWEGGGQGDIVSGLAVINGTDLLVQTGYSGLWAVRADGGTVGQIIVPWPGVPDGGIASSLGLAWFPQASGPGIVVDCAKSTHDIYPGLVAFSYGGPGDFNGSALDTPAALWTAPTIPASGAFNGVFASGDGVAATPLLIFSSNPSPTPGYLPQFAAADGGPLPQLMTSAAVVRGGGLGAGGVVVVGANAEARDAGQGGGLAELFTASGCSAITQGDCANTDCPSACTGGVPMPVLTQVAWIGGVRFLATEAAGGRCTGCTPGTGKVLHLLDFDAGTDSVFFDSTGTSFGDLFSVTSVPTGQ